MASDLKPPPGAAKPYSSCGLWLKNELKRDARHERRPARRLIWRAAYLRGSGNARSVFAERPRDLMRRTDVAHLLQQDRQTGVAIIPPGHKIGVLRHGLGGDFLAAIRAGKNAKLEAFAVDGVRFDPVEMRGSAALATRSFNGVDYFVHGCLTSSP